MDKPWQHGGVILVLAVIAAVAGWRRRPWTVALVAATVMTVWFVATWGVDPHQDGLFVLGAVMAGVATFIGVAFVAFVADGLAQGKPPGQSLLRAMGLSPGWRRRPVFWLGLALLLAWWFVLG